MNEDPFESLDTVEGQPFARTHGKRVVSQQERLTEIRKRLEFIRQQVALVNEMLDQTLPTDND